jgi:copper chaperone CopZ
MASLKLTVAGMTCGHCKMKVEQALKGVAGTLGAAVFLEDGAAEVDYDPAVASPEQHLAAVRAAGYQPSLDA